MKGLWRWILRLLLVVVLGLPLLLGLLLFAAIDREPLVTGTANLTTEAIGRAVRLLEQNDPRRMRAGVLRTITVQQEDLDLAANYAANRFGKGSARIALQDGSATVLLSIRLPRNPLGEFLNIDAALVETASLPRFDHLRIGHLPVPAWVANALLDSGLGYLQSRADYAGAADTIKQVSARNGMLTVAYEWNEDVPNQLRSSLVPQAEQERIKAYQTRLASITYGPPERRKRPLSELVQSLFQLAAERSASGAGSAIEENRAAIVVLTFYVNGKGLKAIIPAARNWPIPVPSYVTLAERHDTAQHFTISAALAATAGSPLSNAVGLYKEIQDSRGGSGFSFNDLAADKAGTRFGELAGDAEATARKLQQQLLAKVLDSTLLPPVSDLPEDMQEPEFKRRFGGVDAPAYRKMVEDIDRRVAGLALYR